MIETRKPNHIDGGCNACTEPATVIVYLVRVGIGRIEIRFCDSCRRETISELTKAVAL